MASDDSLRILTLNSGSSSLKFAVYDMGPSETLALSGAIERIGLGRSPLHISDGRGRVLVEEELELADHDAALASLLARLRDDGMGRDCDAVGHRLVHGGSEYRQPRAITDELMEALRKLIPLAPDHLPREIGTIEAVSRAYPSLPQVACFDTAFHREMPLLAQLYALPAELREEGVIRYGFHGLSYEYLMQQLGSEAGAEAAQGRVVAAHLGNGCSMAAIKHGRSIDTTMGFTPAGGLVMSTRSGDLDPGVMVYLVQEKGLASKLNELVNQQSGLLGVSGVSSDMKDLLEREERDPRAAEAVALFCYQARKFVAALAAALGGLDTLIFTGGIGEKSPPIRWRICQDLEFLGISIDPARNDANAAVISREGAPATARVIETNEALMIARHSYRVIRNRGRPDDAPAAGAG